VFVELALIDGAFVSKLKTLGGGGGAREREARLM